MVEIQNCSSSFFFSQLSALTREVTHLKQPLIMKIFPKDGKFVLSLKQNYSLHWAFFNDLEAMYYHARSHFNWACIRLPKLERSAVQLLAADLPHCWLYLSKQAVNHFMVFMHLDRVLFSRLKRSVEQVLTVDLSAHTVGAGRFLIGRSIISQVPLTPGQS